MEKYKLEKPFFSVVIPTYNHEVFLEKAVKSVLNQTFTDYEIIIIDNYSDDNTENFPVTGISWFEARAYARYKGYKLPNIFQWLCAAGLAGFVSDLPDITSSNLKSSQFWDVDDRRGENYFGLKNIAGNVREWTTNPQGDERSKFSILGGSYHDNAYSFNNYHSISPFDRSIGNGFRIAHSTNSENLDLLDNYIINHSERDILSETDVSDEVFSIYKQQFDYDQYELDVKVDSIFDHDNYLVIVL